MAEKIQRHVFRPEKGRMNVCMLCPFMFSNPIHIKTVQAPGIYIRGIASPNKTG